jgi:uncharacterized RDD family membrane protein YckC
VGFWRRLAAICYDLLLVTALLMVVTGVVILLRGGASIDSGTFWFQGVLLGAWWFYFAWSWTHGGQTVGMRAWRFGLTAGDGGTVNWQQASLRFLAAGLSLLAVGIGFLWCLVDHERLCWHDRLSKTAPVMREKSPESQHRETGDDE